MVLPIIYQKLNPQYKNVCAIELDRFKYYLVKSWLWFECGGRAEMLLRVLKYREMSSRAVA